MHKVCLCCVGFLLVVGSGVRVGGEVAVNGAGGFLDEVVLTGLEQPIDLAFGVNGHVFVAEKRGTVQFFESINDPTPSLLVDLRTEVHNFWDRGLLGIALHPMYPEEAWLYLVYTRDAPPGESPPWWGAVDDDVDACPDPPGAVDEGCVATGVLARVEVGELSGVQRVVETLVSGWCQQFPSHSLGDVVFAADGSLFVAAGDGAAHHTVDIGQLGHDYWNGNPCGDPPDEGGALRAQDLATSGDPAGLNGALLRVDAATGAAVADNPLVGNGLADDDRIVAFGLRNPFRIAVDPDNGSIYLADVGWGSFDELNRVVDATDQVVENFGWPCREGQAVRPGYGSTSMCQLIEAGNGAAGTLVAPFLAINHQVPPDPERCTASGTFLTGVTVGGASYPSPWASSLFVVDSGSGCLWALPRNGAGIPDVQAVGTFPVRLLGAVALVDGPGGELYYPNLFLGRVHRLRSDPGVVFADDLEYGTFRWSDSVGQRREQSHDPAEAARRELAELVGKVEH